jgi:hypothetical protein
VLLSYTATQLSEKSQLIVNRQASVPVFGNLTMVHYGVNRSVRNREFDVKRNALFEHSNLQLNKALMTATIWDETAIVRRSELLFTHAVKVWSGPA